jgi:hypothetical protein
MKRELGWINLYLENGDRNMKKRFSFTFYSNPSGIHMSYTAKQREGGRNVPDKYPQRRRGQAQQISAQ